MTGKGTLDFPVWNNYSRTAQATVKLQTGGKAQIKRRNLFCLQATVDEVTGPMYDHWDLADTASVKASVPSTQVSIGGYGKLGSDGKLWVGLPDNESVDITPKTKARYYTFDDVSASKHLLTITANSALLAPNRFAYGSTNCVGQKVNLDSTLMPQVPEITSAEYEWILHGGFKNRITAGSAGCTIYDIDESIQRRQNTYAWWYIKGTKGIVCRWNNIAFSNGQKVENINVLGKMRVYKPQAWMHLIGSQGQMAQFKMLNQTADSCMLSIGDAAGVNAMIFQAKIATAYAGWAFWTQLCAIDTSNGAWTRRLDFREHYMGEPSDRSIVASENPPGSANSVNFMDGPAVESGDPVRYSGQYEAYLRFRPNAGIPDENIYITIGIVYWNINGIANNNPWRLTTDVITVPSGPVDSSEFPVWDNVFKGKNNLIF